MSPLSVTDSLCPDFLLQHLAARPCSNPLVSCHTPGQPQALPVGHKVEQSALGPPCLPFSPSSLHRKPQEGHDWETQVAQERAGRCPASLGIEENSKRSAV